MAAQKIAEVCLVICLTICYTLGSAQYISFLGTTLANHSYVNFSLVGSGDDSVLCHTDLSTCCSGSQGANRGDWYFPNGTRLLFKGDIYEGRGAQIVNLSRTTTGNVSGIYRCDIPTNAVHDDTDISVRDTVYVGLYITGGNDGSIALTFHHYCL